MCHVTGDRCLCVISGGLCRTSWRLPDSCLCPICKSHLFKLCYQNVLSKKGGIKALSIFDKPQNINIGASNSGGSGQQTVSVNNAHNVANVDYNNGWDSWHTLWDYNTVGSPHDFYSLHRRRFFWHTQNVSAHHHNNKILTAQKHGVIRKSTILLTQFHPHSVTAVNKCPTIS